MMSPEEKLILRCLHSIISGEPMGELPALDWDQVIQLAEVNRVIPILQSTIPEDAIPAAFSTRIDDSARRLRMRAAVMIDEFQRIHDELMMAAIEVIPIKGIAISQMAYPSPSMRYFDDLDLLVREEVGKDSLDILAKLGYEPHPNAPRPEWHHLVPYIHRKRGTMVEIHFDLVRRSNQGWGIDEIWDRSETGNLDSKPTRLLSTEDNLINTALHARHNLYQRLSSFLDIALLANTGGDERDFSTKLSRLAKDAGAICALEYCLEMSGRLLDIETLPDLECSASRRRIAYQVGGWNSLAPKSASLKQGPLPRITELFLMDSLRDSLSLAARLVAPPRSFIDSDGEGERTPLYRYALRFSSRLRQAVKQFVQMIRGE
jgi:hypothetical protein